MRHWENYLYYQEKITMGMHHTWFHHLNKKKKHNPLIQKYMDKWIYIIALIWPILTIPQVWMIWVHKNAESISLFTWGAYVLSAILWFIYGVIHKDKAIIFSNILWMIVNIAVLIWTIIYG